MERAVLVAAALVRAWRRAWTKKWRFSALFVVIFVGSIAILAQLDLLPDPPPPAANPTAVIATSTPAVTLSTSAPQSSPESPVKISIPAISLSANIADPTTTNLEALDQLLLKGAVRYPTSALLGQNNGNVVIFGHSSYLPVVYNPAYKTFDGIQKLTTGDLITVYSADRAYEYAVRTVQKENATEAAIPLSVTGQVLTLSTCNVFGQKSDRFVVTADFVGSHPNATS